ncbi:MAG: hypothetical protein ACFKPT_01225 [Gloeotrichia echinulata GP01]
MTRIKSQESRVKSQESRVKSQGSRVKSQESRVKSQESRVKFTQISQHQADSKARIYTKLVLDGFLMCNQITGNLHK